MTDLIDDLRQQLAAANERLTQTVSDFRNLAETLRFTTAELESEREAVAALGRSFDAMRTERDAEREARKALEEALRSAGRCCAWLHHAYDDRHDFDDPCPVEARISAALSLAAKLP